MAQIYRSGHAYGGGRPDRLTPHEIRTHEFAPRRRGIDHEEVRAFQRRLADELSATLQELRIACQENDRLKRALRDWQTQHARRCDPEQRSRGNTGRW